jgi:hypothetical protein
MPKSHLEADTSFDEDPVNPRIENEIDIQYWFPNNSGPNSSNSIFCSQSEFIDALIMQSNQHYIHFQKLPD